MIVIARDVLRQIMDAAESAYPGECCGLLAGHVLPSGAIEVTRAYRSANLSRERKRFEIDPRLWVDVSRALGRGPLKVVGLYHSHPDGPAQPSAVDLEAAWGEELAWVIVSVSSGAEPLEPGDEPGRPQAIQVTAHILDHDGQQFRPLVVRTPDWTPYPVRAPVEPPKSDD